MNFDVESVPVISILVCGGLLFACVMKADRWRRAWIVPAVLSAVFMVISVRAVVVEGPFGFWTEHTRNLWGNQIFGDLLLAATCAVGLSADSARRHGLRLWVWVIFILGSGSVGLCAYSARLLYLETHSPRKSTSYTSSN